jgi:Glu/Leu/Phe/Val dehydrogenase, dimerisation domain
MEREGHEQVVFCRDRSTGLRAIVAIHDTTLGPSLGGVRMRAYASESEALTDVLRLSEAMTLKASLAGLEFGGGKSVILGGPEPIDRPALFRAMGRFIDSLGGRYIPTEDLGTYTADIEHLGETSRFGVGVAESLGGGGDPSPMTAWGVMCGMQAAMDAAGLPRGPGGYHHSRALATTERIEPTLRGIFAESARSGAPPGTVALRLAHERIAARRRGGATEGTMQVLDGATRRADVARGATR